MRHITLQINRINRNLKRNQFSPDHLFSNIVIAIVMFVSSSLQVCSIYFNPSFIRIFTNVCAIIIPISYYYINTITLGNFYMKLSYHHQPLPHILFNSIFQLPTQHVANYIPPNICLPNTTQHSEKASCWY